LKHNKGSLTEGAVGKKLGLLTLPVAFGMGAAVTFNLADTWFVAQLGVDELAAMSYTFPLAFLLHAFSVGLGIGVTAVLSKTFGSGESGTITSQCVHALMLAAITGLIFLSLGFLLFKPLFTLLGAEARLFPLIQDYVYIWLIGTLFQLVVHIGEGALRASGDMVTPSAILLGATLLNIILDPLLIFGVGPFPRLEMKGAALTTVFSSFVACTVLLALMAWKKGLLTITGSPFSGFIATTKRFFHIGMPAILVQLILPLSLGILTGLASAHSEETVAALGAALRLETLAMIIFIAHSAVLMPFIGQNLGSKKKSRIYGGLTFSSCFILVWGTLSAIVLWFIAPAAANSFTEHPEAAVQITQYLRIVPFSLPLYGLFILGTTALNGFHKPIDSAGINVVRLLVFFIPLTWLGNTLFGFKGMLWGLFITNIASGIVAIAWLYRVAKKQTADFDLPE